MPQPKSTTRKTLYGLIVFFAAFFIGIGFAEIALRLAGISFPSFHRFDESRFMTGAPNVEGWYKDEGESYVKMNPAGFHDVPHEKAKPDGVFRIAVLGDSFAEALQVTVDKTFWKILEKDLSSCQGRNVEVLNFGVSGYGTAQQLLTLREDVWAYSPDMVLLAFLANNDVQDNSEALTKKDFIPYYVVDGSGNLGSGNPGSGNPVLDETYKQSKTYRLRAGFWSRSVYYPLINNSRTMQLVKRFFDLRSKRKQLDKQNREATRTSLEEYGTKVLVYKEPSDDLWKSAWTVTEAMIALMNREVKAKGASFVVVTLTGSHQIHPDPKHTRAFMEAVGTDTLFYPETRVKALGAKEGFPVVNLAPRMLKTAQETGTYFHGFSNTAMGTGHWNEQGHLTAAKIIAEQLCK